MAIERPVCPENDALVDHIRKWWKEYSEKNPLKCNDKLNHSIQKALANVCRHESPITTLKQFHAIKGVGKWILSEMRGFFKPDSSENDTSPKKGKKSRGSRRYLPQKNSAAYALLITLYREEIKGVEHMRKQELIDAAEASGLSCAPIGPEKGRGKLSHIGSSSRELYSGWSAMGKLVDKGLVGKSSCPAKYKLSDEGRHVAIECLSRSSLIQSSQSSVRRDECSDSEKIDAGIIQVTAGSPKERTMISVDLEEKNYSRDDISAEFLERFARLGYSREQVQNAWADVSLSSSNKEPSSLWLTVLCLLREDEVYGDQPMPQPVTVESCSGDVPNSNRFTEGNDLSETGGILTKSQHLQRTISCFQASENVFRMPPLKYLERFEDVYKVILMLDDRERFTRSANMLESIRKEFKIEIEVKRLPVGDAIWIAHHKQLLTNYVLDFIVERKNVDDLRSSIRDNRYRDQKLRLMRTGLKKIIYVVEGDPNSCEGSDSIKTACFTTEILEGFDVQRTSGVRDTLRHYGFLTLAIAEQYKLNAALTDHKTADKCLKYEQFIRKCDDVDKLTVSDVFATQLMQVSQVTEEIAVAVLNCYPTLYSLASAYALLDGDTCAQEDLLFMKSKGVISSVASRNISRFIWGS